MAEPAAAEERFVRRALALRTFLRDPALPGFALMAGLVLAGFGAMVFAWYGVAKIIYVPLQFPRALSGGIGGLALVGVGVALFDLQNARRNAARETQLTDDVLDEIAHLVALAPKLKRKRRRSR
jgi:hypothetical protein